jgi:hypothetical protein
VSCSCQYAAHFDSRPSRDGFSGIVGMASRIVHMREHDAAAELDRLSEEFFEVAHTTDPFNATLLGQVVTRWADRADGSAP